MDEKSKIIDKAQKLVQKGYLDKAVAEYKRIIDKDPKDATIRLRIGDLYVKVGKKDEAIKEYGEVAKQHTQRGFYLKAIAVYKQILKLDEGLMDIHFKLADLYTKQKLIADAVASLSVLVAFYEKKKKNDEAIDVLKKMATIDSQNVGVRFKLAEYYQIKGFTNDALAEYGTAFNSLLSEGKLDKAEKLYQGLYADNRQNISVVEGLAEVCKRKNDKDQLVRYYKELADLYERKGETEKRKEFYAKVLEIYPHDDDALNATGRKPAGEEPAQEAAPGEASAEQKPSEEPLISWPKISGEEEQVKPQEPAEPAPLKEEPLISWNEVIEVNHEAMPSSPEAEIEETPLVDAEVKEVIPSEEEREKKSYDLAETVPEETSPEYVEPVKEITQPEEIETGKIVEEPAEHQGLEGLGLKEFTPEEPAAGEEAEPHAQEGYVDLSSELGLEEALDFLTESWETGAKGEETFTEFKHGVEKQLSKEDTETHYNLGIAYMEMELYDDAMREFKIALKDPVFEFDCHSRLGLSFMAKRDYAEAVNSFLKGLKVSGRTDQERKGLMYELALAYEASGTTHEALEIFKSVYEMDKRFREVASKIKELTEKFKKEGEVGLIPSRDDILEVEIL